MSTERNNNLDAIRFAAAAALIYGQAFALNGMASPGFLSNSVQTIGVKIVFMLSGFLIAQSWEGDAHLFRFLARRAIRILPGLALVLLLSGLVLGPAFTTLPSSEYFRDSRFWSYLGNIGLEISYDLPGVFAKNPYPNAVSGSLWSLPVMGCMYLLAPAVLTLAALSRRPRLILWLVVMGSVAASTIFVHLASRPLTTARYGIALSSLLDVAPFFAIGALCFSYGLHHKLSAQTASLALLLSVLFPSQSAVIDELVLTALVPVVVLGLGFAGEPRFAKAGRFGDVSYGLYLYGFPVQQAVTALHGGAMSPLLGAAISLLISLGLSLASWHLVEKNALMLRPRARRAPAFGSVTAPAERPAPGSRRQGLEAAFLFLLLNLGLGLPGLLYRERRWGSFSLGLVQLSLEVVLLTLLVLWTPERWRKLAAALAGVVYTAVLVFLAYHFAFAASFQRVPAIGEDLPLALNLFHFLHDLLGAGIWLLALAIVSVLVALTLGVRRSLETIEETTRPHPRWRHGFAALVVLGAVIAFARSGERVQFRTRTIANNLATSRERAAKVQAALAQGPDTRYRRFAEAKLQRTPNVYLLMLEAYGQRLSADPEMKAPFRELTARMESRLAEAGFHVRSSLSEAPVFGGRSWLSIATVQTGIRVDQPGVFALLEPVAAKLPSLTAYFHRQGYATWALQPGNVDRVGLDKTDIFRRDMVIDGPELEYRGTPYGWVKTPDQYSLGYFSERLSSERRPYFAFFMSVSTHHPWLAVPFAKDWKTLNTPELVEVADWEPIHGSEAIAEGFPRRYFESVTYEWRALADFIERESSPDAIFILVGDHQPLLEREAPEDVDPFAAAAATQSHNTFVHVISRDQELVEQFAQSGFTPGLFVEPGHSSLKHEGLFSLIVTQVSKRHGDPAAPEKATFYPEGIGLSGLLP